MSGRLPLGAQLIDRAVDRGLPDTVLRAAIRLLLARRRRGILAGTVEDRTERARQLIAQLSDGPITVAVDDANAQHYEVPTALFELMLGPRMKYSSAWWPDGVDTLAEAEEAMLALTAERAGLQDGQDVLELGCGWGSLTLWMAERYPSSRIVAVSNSTTQAAAIRQQAADRGLRNVTVVTCDVADLGVSAGNDQVGPDRFDRVVSVEMFEHVRNHRALAERIATWLRPGGELFVHVFVHASQPYTLDTGGRGDWMARHFFTGGTMPSADLLPRTVGAVPGLRQHDQWAISGRHYARTLRAWLDRLDANRMAVLQVLAGAPGEVPADAALHRWRTFTMACEELFAARSGEEWYVGHSRFVVDPPAHG